MKGQVCTEITSDTLHVFEQSHKYGIEALFQHLRRYDFLFVIPAAPKTFTPGGHIVVYELCRRLARDGYKTGLVFIRDPEAVLRRRSLCVPLTFQQDVFKFKNYMVGLFPFSRLMNGTVKAKPSDTKKSNNFVLRNSIRIFYNICDTYVGYRFIIPVMRRLLDVTNNYDEKLLKEVDLFFGNKIKPSIVTDRIVAMGFITAFCADEYSREDAMKYYLIQGFDDNPAVSYELADVARLSYYLRLKKIVINRQLYQRFQHENPLFFHIGFDNRYFKVETPIESRDRESVVIQLMQQETKGASYGIMAMEALKKEIPSARIVAFGNLPRNQVPPFVEYQFLPTREILRALHNRSAIFVLPSIAEGMPLPPLEAMSCGCAVVTTDNGGVSEYIQDQNNGVITPSKSSVGIKEAIVDLILNDDKRIRIARAGLQTSREFSYENMYKGFVGAIRDFEGSAQSPLNGQNDK